MPEHTTWFAYLPNYQNLVRIIQSWAGPTWVGKAPLDLQHVFGALVVAAVLIFIAILLRAAIMDEKEALVPEERLTLRNFMEVVVEIVLGFMEDIMGRKAARYFFPLIGTCAFFIFFSNISGLLPGLSPPTSNLNTTLACALIIFFSTHIFGTKEHGIGYFAHFFGPLRPQLKWHLPLTLVFMVLMFVVDLIGHLARPMSLSIRLMGNMFADHSVLGVFFLLAPLLVPIPLMLLGLLVAIVQTMVFTLLSMVYIGSAIAHEEH